MTHMIEKMTMAVPSGADRLLDTLAKAVSDTPSAPVTALDRYQASRTAVQIKTNTQSELVGTLSALGAVSVSAAAATTLFASGHKLPVAEIDAALSRAKVGIQDRIRLKNAMARFGILKA